MRLAPAQTWRHLDRRSPWQIGEELRQLRLEPRQQRPLLALLELVSVESASHVVLRQGLGRAVSLGVGEPKVTSGTTGPHGFLGYPGSRHVASSPSARIPYSLRLVSISTAIASRRCASVPVEMICHTALITCPISGFSWA